MDDQKRVGDHKKVSLPYFLPSVTARSVVPFSLIINVKRGDDRKEGRMKERGKGKPKFVRCVKVSLPSYEKREFFGASGAPSAMHMGTN